MVPDVRVNTFISTIELALLIFYISLDDEIELVCL